MFRRGQSSLEYITVMAIGMIIAAIVIYRLIGVKGLAREVGNKMNQTEKELSRSLENLGNRT